MSYTTQFGKLKPVGKKHSWWGVKPPAQPTFPADKGDLGGSCNRRDCLRPGANWYNHSTRQHYCASCAHRLNTDEFNRRDAMALWGHDLCTEVTEEKP